MESLLGLVVADEWWVSMSCFIVIALSSGVMAFSQYKMYKLFEKELIADKKENHKKKRLEELNRLKQQIKKEEEKLIDITE